MNKPQLSIIVPLYNESEVFELLVERIVIVINEFDISTEVVFINDGSHDGTALKMKELALSDSRFHCVFLSKNHGHQIAISAGLHFSNATEAVLIMDGDLQDPPELLPEFYKHYLEGYDVVYGVRRKRKESIFLRSAYYIFYRLLKIMSDTTIPLDSGDFALISRRVVDIINSMPEKSRFVRGMRTWVGFNQIELLFERDKRTVGKPKYTIRKLINLAYDGIINFSSVPMKLMSNGGVLCIIISLSYFIYVLVRKFFIGDVPVGFTALLFMVIFFGGLQLLSIGILGEYIIRIFFQVKNRPLFIVESRILNKKVINGNK